MWKDKDQERSILASRREVCNRQNIGGKLDSWQVFDILMGRVNDLREFSWLSFDLYRLFKDPHVDLGLIKGKSLAISTHDGRNRRAPVSASNDADLVELTVGVLGVCDKGVVHWICHFDILVCVVSMASRDSRIVGASRGLRLGEFGMGGGGLVEKNKLYRPEEEKK